MPMLAALWLAAVLGPPRISAAQTAQFGIQDRADAARQMIALAVQQAIGALPPTSAQSFTYRFDPATDTYIADAVLGPTAFRSPQVIGKGRLSLRAAASYFEVDDTLGPIRYELLSNITPPGYCTAFGVKVSSKTGLLNLGATYGISDRIEADFNLPLVFSDTEGYQTFVSTKAGEVTLAPCGALASARLPVAKLPFSGIVGPGGQTVKFNDGTNAGVGRISLTGKAMLYASQRLDVAVAPEFYFPSPNEAEFAGSASAALLPRLVAQVTTSLARLHADVGYDWNFDNAELRRFVWNVGASVPVRTPRCTFDVGLGGSLFERGIQWTPERAPYLNASGSQSGTIQALGPTRLGTDFVDFLFGAKVAITERIVLSGAVSVPVSNDGFRPQAAGTVVVESALF
jgi:hypothetical protein